MLNVTVCSNTPSSDGSNTCDWAKVGSEAQVNYMKKWPKCLWFPFCYTAFSQPAPLASVGHREYPWFTDGSTQHAGITPKWTVASIQPLSGTSLKDSGEEKFPHWAELQDVRLVHFAWKDK